jgi:hypothetical protein
VRETLDAYPAQAAFDHALREGAEPMIPPTRVTPGVQQSQ